MVGSHEEPVKLVIVWDDSGRAVVRRAVSDLNDLSAAAARVGGAVLGGSKPALRELEQDLTRTANSMRVNMASAIDGIHFSVGRLIGSVTSLARTGFYTLAAAAGTASFALVKLGNSFVEVNERFAGLEITLKSAYRSLSVARDLRNELAKITAASPIPFAGLADATRVYSVLPQTRSTIAMQSAMGTLGDTQGFYRQSIKLIEQMLAFRPDKTEADAIFAIREALSGQFRSLVRCFDIPAHYLTSTAGQNLEQLKNDPMGTFRALKGMFDKIITPEAITEYTKQPRILFQNMLEQIFEIPALTIGDQGVYKKILGSLNALFTDIQEFITKNLLPIAQRINDSLISLWEGLSASGGKMVEWVLGKMGMSKEQRPDMDINARIAEGIGVSIDYIGRKVPELGAKLGDFIDRMYPIVKRFAELIVKVMDTVLKYPMASFAAYAVGPSVLSSASGMMMSSMNNRAATAMAAKEVQLALDSSTPPVRYLPGANRYQLNVPPAALQPSQISQFNASGVPLAALLGMQRGSFLPNAVGQNFSSTQIGPPSPIGSRIGNMLKVGAAGVGAAAVGLAEIVIPIAAIAGAAWLASEAIDKFATAAAEATQRLLSAESKTLFNADTEAQRLEKVQTVSQQAQMFISAVAGKRAAGYSDAGVNVGDFSVELKKLLSPEAESQRRLNQSIAAQNAQYNWDGSKVVPTAQLPTKTLGLQSDTELKHFNSFKEAQDFLGELTGSFKAIKDVQTSSDINASKSLSIDLTGGVLGKSVTSASLAKLGPLVREQLITNIYPAAIDAVINGIVSQFGPSAARLGSYAPTPEQLGSAQGLGKRDAYRGMKSDIEPFMSGAWFDQFIPAKLGKMTSFQSALQSSEALQSVGDRWTDFSAKFTQRSETFATTIEANRKLDEVMAGNETVLATALKWLDDPSNQKDYARSWAQVKATIADKIAKITVADYYTDPREKQADLRKLRDLMEAGENKLLDQATILKEAFSSDQASAKDASVKSVLTGFQVAFNKYTKLPRSTVTKDLASISPLLLQRLLETPGADIGAGTDAIAALLSDAAAIPTNPSLTGEASARDTANTGLRVGAANRAYLEWLKSVNQASDSLTEMLLETAEQAEDVSKEAIAKLDVKIRFDAIRKALQDAAGVGDRMQSLMGTWGGRSAGADYAHLQTAFGQGQSQLGIPAPGDISFMLNRSVGDNTLPAQLEKMNRVPQILDDYATKLRAALEARKGLKDSEGNLLVSASDEQGLKRMIDGIDKFSDSVKQAKYELTGGGDIFRSYADGFVGAVERMKIAAQDLRSAGAETANSMQANFGNAFSSFIQGSRSASQAFSDFGKAMVKSLADIAAQQASKAIFGMVLGAVSNAFGSSYSYGTSNAGSGYTSTKDSFSGYSYGMAEGGYISGGSGVRDDVPALLMGGEFVMTKQAVREIGAANLAAMNNGSIRRLAAGGPVGTMPSSVASNGTPSVAINVNVTNTGAQSDAKGSNSYNELAKELETAVVTIIHKHSRPGGQFAKLR